MKRIFTTITALIVVIGILSCGSAEQKQSEWTQLFNGQNLDGWIPKINHYDAGVNYDSTFFVHDGMISVRYKNYGDFDDRFGHLFYKTPFSRFHLKLEYRFAEPQQPGAPEWTRLNSGVMYHSQDPRTILKNQDWPISVEMQFLAARDTIESRSTGNMCSPGTDIVFEGKKYDGHCLNSSSKTFPFDEWVKAELVVYGDSLILHIINGDTVLRYTNPTIGGGVVSGYDSTVFQIGTPLKSGYIGLQSEGQPVDFRNIFIRDIK
jgi:hypothetical protein